MEEDFTPEEEAALKEIMEKEAIDNFPQQEEKENIYNYFKKVISMPSNTKTSNLDKEELGQVKLPVRTLQELALYCDSMGMGNLNEQKGFAGYFQKESQIILGTALSKEGFLNQLAVTQKRESEVRTKRMSAAQKKNWFKKSQPQEVEYN